MCSGSRASASERRYRAEIAKMREQWHDTLTGRWTDKLSLSRVLHTAREVLPREAVAIASLPDQVRGYEDIKLDRAATYRSQLAERLSRDLDAIFGL